jgi:hypothetical protein
MMSDASRGDAEWSRGSAVQRFIWFRAEDCQQIPNVAALARPYEHAPQPNFLTRDHSEIRNWGTILGKSTAQIDTEIAQLITHLEHGSSCSINAFNDGRCHVWIYLGEPKFV